jgi:uncharacterized protein (TIGR03435 family)
MLQNLLADRCGLKIHKESTETSGFALVIDKSGPKLTEHDPADKNYHPITPVGPGKVKGINATMNLFALFISRGPISRQGASDPLWAALFSTWTTANSPLRR